VSTIGLVKREDVTSKLKGKGKKKTLFVSKSKESPQRKTPVSNGILANICGHSIYWRSGGGGKERKEKKLQRVFLGKKKKGTPETANLPCCKKGAGLNCCRGKKEKRQQHPVDTRKGTESC